MKVGVICVGVYGTLSLALVVGASVLIGEFGRASTTIQHFESTSMTPPLVCAIISGKYYLNSSAESRTRTVADGSAESGTSTETAAGGSSSAGGRRPECPREDIFVSGKKEYTYECYPNEFGCYYSRPHLSKKSNKATRIVYGAFWALLGIIVVSVIITVTAAMTLAPEVKKFI